MSLNFYFVFFILSTSSWFTSALKCYKCEEKNPDADLINSFCSRLYNKNSWEIVECSGSCFSGSKPNPNVQGRRVGQRFVNPTYSLTSHFLQLILLSLQNCFWGNTVVERVYITQFFLQNFLVPARSLGLKLSYETCFILFWYKKRL